ncbi:MAG: hypothetical protein FWG99_02570 [Treponema sp.]|nr:hypothetical protein [Treponema sp.]
MALDRSKVIKLTILCILAALMNIFTTIIFRDYLGLPLYIDTVFTAAVAFAAGLIPGIAVAVLGWFIPCLYYNHFNFYVFCSIAEVLLICALKPAAPEISRFDPKEKIIASYTGLAAKLILLYVVCAVSISVLGGIINYVSDVFLEMHLRYYSVEDTFKLGLMMSNLPALAVNILSRIQVNIVDRFIVIFGGYFISRGLIKIAPRNVR